MTLSLKSVESGSALADVATDAVSDDAEAALLPLDPTLLPIPHCVDISNQQLDLHSVFYRLTNSTFTGLCAASVLPKRHAEHLLQATFELDVSGIGYQDASRILSQRLVGWLSTRTTSTSNGFILAFVPQSTAAGDEVVKVQLFRGDAVELSSWFADRYTEALGRHEHTFSIYRVRDSSALVDPIVLVPNIVGGLRPTVGVGQIRGRLTVDDVPLAGARITALALDPAAPVLPPVLTDSGGNFALNNCPDGEYSLVWEKAGYSTFMEESVTVDASGGATVINLRTGSAPDGHWKVDTRRVYLRRGEDAPVAFQVANLGQQGGIPWRLSLTSRTFEEAGVLPTASSGIIAPGTVLQIGFQVRGDATARHHTGLLKLRSPVTGEERTAILDVVVLGGDSVDHAVVNASLSDATVRRGRTTDLNYRISRTGGAYPHCLRDVRLSEDQVISAEDRLLAQGDLQSYYPPQTGSGTQRLTIPEDVEPGNYYVGIRLDSTDLLQETDESNNVMVVPVTITDSSGGGEVEIGPFSVTARTARDSRRSEIEVRWTRARGATEYRIRRLSSTSAQTAVSVPMVVRDWASSALGRVFIDEDVVAGQQGRYEVDARNGSSAVRTAASEAASASSGRREQNLVANGSFSAGSGSWTLSGDFWAGVDPELTSYASAPGYAAGGVNRVGEHVNNAQGSLEQEIFLPPVLSNARLTLRYNISTEETAVRSSFDTMTVAARLVDGREIPLVTLSNLNATGGRYETAAARMDSLIGHRITLVVRCATNESNKTVFRLDDVVIKADARANEVAEYFPRWPFSGRITTVTSPKRNGVADGCPDPEYQRDYPQFCPHLAFDLASQTAEETQVRPIAPGTITHIDRVGTPTLGRHIRIDHGDGFGSEYAHLASIPAALAELGFVDLEAVIGIEGSTGTQHKHLHFSLFRMSSGAELGKSDRPNPTNYYASDGRYQGKWHDADGRLVSAGSIVQREGDSISGWPTLPGTRR